jgi:thioredoxin-like negative regulator of GroEL
MVPDLSLTSQLAYARVLIDSDDSAGATAVCRRILSALPRCMHVYPLLAEAMLRRGDTGRAEALYGRVFGVDPQDARSALGMSVIERSRNASRAAQAWLQRAQESALDQDLASAGWLWSAARGQGAATGLTLSGAGLANLMLRSGMFSQAAQEYRDALTRWPRRDDLAVGLAEATLRSADVESAREACQGLLLRLPDCVKALLILGRIELGTGEESRGREMLRHAQTLDPENRLAQRLFGGDSPLPVRSVRIPALETEPLLLLPYLDDAEEGDEREDDAPPPSLQSIL